MNNLIYIPYAEDIIPLALWLDYWYHRGRVPKFIGQWVCNRLELWFDFVEDL